MDHENLLVPGIGLEHIGAHLEAEGLYYTPHYRPHVGHAEFVRLFEPAVGATPLGLVHDAPLAHVGSFLTYPLVGVDDVEGCVWRVVEHANRWILHLAAVEWHPEVELLQRLVTHDVVEFGGSCHDLYLRRCAVDLEQHLLPLDDDAGLVAEDGGAAG